MNDKNILMAPGFQLDDFRIIRPIGVGGMGLVFEAEQLSLNRRVAIKILGGFPCIERFQREAKAVARLSHRSTAQIYTVNHSNGIWYIAMELIKGVEIEEGCSTNLASTHHFLPSGKTLMCVRSAQLPRYNTGESVALTWQVSSNMRRWCRPLRQRFRGNPVPAE